MCINLIVSAQQYEIDNKLLSELKIKEEEVWRSEAKSLPTNPNQSIVAIVKKLEDPEAFECDLILVLIDNSTGKIVSKSVEEEKYTSDAIALSMISIDFAPYKVTDNQTAFGIRTTHYGSSGPNPYGDEYISLYIFKDNAFQLILDELQTNLNVGETNMRCIYNGTDTNSVLIMQKTKTNGYYDIKVKSVTTINTSKNPKVEGDDCITSEKKLKPTYKIFNFIKGKYEVKK